jgi:hypothetical protein
VRPCTKDINRKLLFFREHVASSWISVQQITTDKHLQILQIKQLLASQLSSKFCKLIMGW